jgi:pyruvate/2-oxoglutarate dehydrogenase complex dihydrolipoamide dehydrogenase (E3) component
MHKSNCARLASNPFREASYEGASTVADEQVPVAGQADATRMPSMNRRSPEYDLCVVGGGSAGLSVAAGAALLGARVALIEKHRLGGECLYSGCVPSKALLRTAQVASIIHGAQHFGLSARLDPPALSAVMTHVQDVIAAIAPHDSPERFRGLGVNVIEGAASFTDRNHVAVNGQVFSARRFVIATGSAPAIPPIPGLNRVPYLTNATIFGLREAVPRLAVIGGGPIGVELAQAFARLGSEVCLLEAVPRILPQEDADVAEVLEEQLRREGVKLITGARIEEINSLANGGIRVMYLDADQSRQEYLASHLLVATGRRPVIEGLGLDLTGVRCERGALLVDARLRTTQRHIYACGDVIGPYRFTHMSEHQAGVVLRNALLHLRARAETRVVPWCTFTEPEVARVGLSEADAQRQGVQYQAYRVPFTRVDRAHTDGETAGFAKLLTSPHGRILGAAIVGPHAGELIQEFALAISRGLKAADVSASIHLYPALAQINRFVADERLKQRLTPSARRWLRRLFRLRGAYV